MTIRGRMVATMLAAGAAFGVSAQSSTEAEIAKYREALAAGNPADLWEARGEALWKQKRGPKNVSLEACDLGKGPGVVKGTYAEMPRHFADADRVMDLETRLAHCMVTLQGFKFEDATRRTLEEPLAITEGLLYRRGNFNGSFDQLILDALMAVRGAEIAFSPGFRWGTTLLPGQAILRDHLMDQTAITYPNVTLNEPTGAEIKVILEDVCDNLFNPDPYLQQGGDMVRVGGMTYACDPLAKAGARISDMRIGGKPIDAGKRYKLAGWAPVAEGAAGEPVWDVVEHYLKDKKTIVPRAPNVPRLIGMERNPGLG